MTRTFLMGQMDLIRKLNYLDVTRILIDHMFFRKRLISKWTMGLVNALNHHWCETNSLPQGFGAGGVPAEISFSRILCMGPVPYPKEVYVYIWYCFIYDLSMLFYITFKKKTWASGSQEGHMWVTSRLLSGSTGVTHFQSWLVGVALELKHVIEINLIRVSYHCKSHSFT